MGLLSALRGRTVYLDTNVFIYALEAFPEFAADLTEFFQALDHGTVAAVTSELTLAEALVKPMRDGDPARQAAYEQAISAGGGLRVAAVDREVLVRAARLRAETGLRLPDAIHAATALAAGCESLLTNDQHLRAVPGITIVLLAEAVTG